MKNRNLIFGLLLLLNMPVVNAQQLQRYNSFSYSVNEGLLQSTIGTIAFDKNNFCWLTFPNGIQKFDGKNFSMVPIQPGLPDDKLAGLFKCANGDLLISHSQGISKYEIGSDRFVQVYKSGNKAAPVFIGEDDGAVYFYTGDGNIIGINNSDFKLVSKATTGLLPPPINNEYRPKFSDNIIDHKIAIHIKSVIHLWDLKNARLISSSERIPDMSAYTLRMVTANEILYSKYKNPNSLSLYNFLTQSSSSINIKGKDQKVFGRCAIHVWKNKTLISFNGKLFETDSSFQQLNHEIVDFQNKPISENASIADIQEDNFGNLYLHTVTGGIKKIIRHNYPIKYYGVEKESTNVLSILPDKENNRVLVGTSGNGILIFDTLQHLVQHIKNYPGHTAPFSANIILKKNNGTYIFFVAGGTNAWQLSSDLSKMTPIVIRSFRPGSSVLTEYFGNPLFQDDKMAFAQSQSKFYKLDLATNIAKEHQITTSYTMGGILHNGVIITHANDEFIFIDTISFNEVKRIPFKNTGYVRCFTKDDGNNIYVGSNKGIFKIDRNGKILSQLKKENGLPDECIYAMCFDKEGFLWCSTNKGILKINNDNSILQLKKEDGLQENEFNTNAVAKTTDGELFFGGVNGVSSFYPGNIGNFEEDIKLLVTGIRANNEKILQDTSTWNISSISLPYNQNSLSFDFIAMANNNPDQYVYQYQMEGIDKGWIQNNELQTVRYFLPPGKYVFKIYASRFFDKEAKPMKEIVITIHPPFWKAWWFILGVILILIAGMWFAINRYNRRKYQKKMDELETEHKIQLERERISRDLHDSIGAYANAVLYNTEMLEKKSESAERIELMNDLKFASKDIITALRETIWALKKENYTADECLLRIKNFLQPFARYYPNIHFKIEGTAPAGLIFHYTKALNIVRIIQEAVANSIKHAGANNIQLHSSNENGQWKLSVLDDGIGFDYEDAKNIESGNGLPNMHKRAEDSGLRLTIQSEIGRQTRVTVIA